MAFLLHYPLNFYIVKIVILKRYNKDLAIGHWQEAFPKTNHFINQISLYHNNKLLRLMTTNLWNKPYFRASFEDQ